MLHNIASPLLIAGGEEETRTQVLMPVASNLFRLAQVGMMYDILATQAERVGFDWIVGHGIAGLTGRQTTRPGDVRDVAARLRNAIAPGLTKPGSRTIFPVWHRINVRLDQAGRSVVISCPDLPNLPDVDTLWQAFLRVLTPHKVETPYRIKLTPLTHPAGFMMTYESSNLDVGGYMRVNRLAGALAAALRCSCRLDAEPNPDPARPQLLLPVIGRM